MPGGRLMLFGNHIGTFSSSFLHAAGAGSALVHQVD